MEKFRLVNRVSKQDDGKYALERAEKETVEQVVQSVRAEFDGQMSGEMRLIADETAREILIEEHGIEVSMARIRRVA